MKRHPAGTPLPAIYIRILVLVFISVGIVRLIPFLSGLAHSLDFLLNQVVNMGILYAILVGFLMSLTLRRKQELEEFVLQELNKGRRIYHLSKHIAKAEPKLNTWFSQVEDALINYNTMFCTRSFAEYELGSPLFRKVTYAIYELPSLKIPYNRELFASLLHTAAAATESREFIRSYYARAIGTFQWAILIVVTLTLSAIIAASTPDDFFSRLVTIAVVFNIFLVLYFLYEFDTSSRKTNLEFAEMYAQNLANVGTCPTEGKKGGKGRKKSAR